MRPEDAPGTLSPEDEAFASVHACVRMCGCVYACLHVYVHTCVWAYRCACGGI